MPEKVTVDILDIEEPLSEEVNPPEEEASQEKWQSGRLLIAGLITAVIFSAGGYVLWTNLSAPPGANEAPPVQTAAPAPETAPAVAAAAPARPATLRTTEIEGFVVDLQDEKGNPRVVLCGFALDADGREASLLDRDTDLRRIIYESLRSRKVESLMTSEGKNALKKEIQELLAKRVGAAPIRDIYFTKFVVL